LTATTLSHRCDVRATSEALREESVQRGIYTGVRVSIRARNRGGALLIRLRRTCMETITTESARARIQIEYIEMPDLKLTHAQVGRLCDLPKDICDAAIASLVESGFLSTTASGSVLRVGRRRPA